MSFVFALTAVSKLPSLFSQYKGHMIYSLMLSLILICKCNLFYWCDHPGLTLIVSMGLAVVLSSTQTMFFDGPINGI